MSELVVDRGGPHEFGHSSDVYMSSRSDSFIHGMYQVLFTKFEGPGGFEWRIKDK
jgi:hypothetical protein